MKIETSVELEQVLVQFQGPQLVLNMKGKLHSLAQHREQNVEFHAQSILRTGADNPLADAFVALVEDAFRAHVQEASNAVLRDEGEDGADAST